MIAMKKYDIRIHFYDYHQKYSLQNVLRYNPPGLIDDKSTFVREMAWYHQATNPL